MARFNGFFMYLYYSGVLGSPVNTLCPLGFQYLGLLPFGATNKEAPPAFFPSCLD